MAVITEIRREKAEKRMPLNTQIKKLTIYAGGKDMAEIITEGREDISGTCKVVNIEIVPEEGEGREIESYSNIWFISEY